MIENLFPVICTLFNNVQGVVLFGSHVDGHADEFSDVDVIVLTDDDAPMRRQKLATKIGLLDVHLHSVKSLNDAWERQRVHHISFYPHALATGQVIYDPQERFVALIERSKSIWPKHNLAVNWTVYRLALMAKIADVLRPNDHTDGLLLATDLYQTILAVQCLYFGRWLGTAVLMRQWCAEERAFSMSRLDAALDEAVDGNPALLVSVSNYWLHRIGGQLTHDEALTWTGLAA